jgi:hypothetical protein
MSNQYSIQPVSKHARGLHRWMVRDNVKFVAVRFTRTKDEAVRYCADRNSVHDMKRYERLGEKS